MSDVIEYKCPSCNASMVFDSKSQHMKCPYCDTEMTVEEFQRTQKSEDTDDRKINFKRQLVLNEHRSVAE